MRVNVTQAKRPGSKVGQGPDPFWGPGDPACATTAPTDSASARSNPLASVASPQASAPPRTGNGPLIRRRVGGASPFIVVDRHLYRCRELVPGYARLTRRAARVNALEGSWSADMDQQLVNRLLVRFIQAAVVDAERLLRVLAVRPALVGQARAEVIRLTGDVYDAQGCAR
jgi:hypothetical protein